MPHRCVTGPLALTAGIGPARAQGRPLTFCSWGGALSDLEKTALLEPFGKLKKIEIAYASPTNYAKIKAMVEAGAPEWDLVDVGGRFIDQGKDLLETLDMSLIPNAKNLDPGWVTSRGIFTSTGATVMAWNTKAFPEDKGPASWKDFWDVKAFPGPRGLYKQLYYNYEAALLAAGTPRQPDLSGHRRQDQGRVREAARDQAAREGMVDRRRATAAAALQRRARAVLGVDRAASSR